MIHKPIKKGYIDKRCEKRFWAWSMVSVQRVGVSKTYDASDHSRPFFANMINISQRGMRIESYEDLKKGSVLRLSFDCQLGEKYKKVSAIGKVIHSGKGSRSGFTGVGIRLLKKSPFYLPAFREIIKN